MVHPQCAMVWLVVVAVTVKKYCMLEERGVPGFASVSASSPQLLLFLCPGCDLCTLAWPVYALSAVRLTLPYPFERKAPFVPDSPMGNTQPQPFQDIRGWKLSHL